MNFRTTLMIALMLFHTTTVWAMSLPVDHCPEPVQTMSADMHDMHAMMQSDDESPMQHDCCDGEMDDVACQLHCASAATAIMQTPLLFKVNAPVGLVTNIASSNRLPPHSRSLLRPPAPLI